LLAHLVGPCAHRRPNAQLYSAAQSRDQAALVFNLATKMIRMNPTLAHAVTIRETAKELECREFGDEVQGAVRRRDDGFWFVADYGHLR
jgi:phage terminase large subunit-like protein